MVEGAGKSYIGILKMLALLDQYPGSRGVIVRQKFNQLKKTTAATLWKLLPKDRIARRNDNAGTLRLTNGSELLLTHLDQPGSIAGMKSLEVNFAYVDQLEDISAEAWDTLYERIGRWSGAMMRGGYPKKWPYVDRLGNPMPPRYIFASAYSPGYDHWITARWWEHGSERERYLAQGYKVIKGSTRDNLALSQEYIDGRLAMGNEYVRRYVDAVDWGANEGRIFDIEEQSIVEPSPELLNRIRRTMRLHRVYDHGEAQPSAMLWYATDAENNVYVYREYMQPNLTVSDHRRNIWNLSKQDSPTGAAPPPYYSNYADPAIFAKNRGKTATSKARWSVADEFVDRRIVDAETAIYFRPAVNDEAATINRVREYLRADGRHFSPFTGQRGAPRVYFLKRAAAYPDGCHELLVDIRSAKREEIGSRADGTKLFGDKRDQKVRDHLLDCLRYALIMRPTKALSADRPPATAGTIRFDDYMDITRAENTRASIEARRNYQGHDYGY